MPAQRSLLHIRWAVRFEDANPAIGIDYVALFADARAATFIETGSAQKFTSFRAGTGTLL